MSNYNIDNIKKITETLMRQYGMDTDSAWNDKTVVEGKTYNNPNNLKQFRDMLSQLILDVLTNVTGSGQLSVANTPGNPSKSGNNTTVSNTTQINNVTDPTMIVWIATVSAAINILVPGSITSIPVSITGKINP